MRRLIFLVLLFFSILIVTQIGKLAGCNVFKTATIKLVIYHDPENTQQILINGQTLSAFERNGANPYAEDYRIYDDKEAFVQITSGEVVLSEQNIQSGTYVINLSKKHSISYQEISYGRYCAPCKSGNKSGIGIIKLSDQSDALPYPFNEKPPPEIRGKNIKSLSDREFFVLRAF